MNEVIDFIHTSRDRYIEELTHFLAIPTQSRSLKNKVAALSGGYLIRINSRFGRNAAKD